MHDEQTIFNELAKLCTNHGYAHIIAYFCFRDNTIKFTKSIIPEDVIAQYSPQRLIRTEIATLHGLMIKSKVDLRLPEPKLFQEMVLKTETLLEELHQTMISAMGEQFQQDTNKKNLLAPSHRSSVLKEAMFYGGESAYEFQYRDFSINKYINDNEWLIAVKGFSIQEANQIISCISIIQNEKINNTYQQLKNSEQTFNTLLSGYIFSVDEVFLKSGISKNKIEKILISFTPPNGSFNEEFNSLNDFNIANPCPLINLGDGQFLLLQNLSLNESLYESPYFWMMNDGNYKNKALSNRGDFTEQFCTKKLQKIFGSNKVYHNIKIIKSKKIICDIDTLVVYADRAIILQAKSKRLTLEARKGNDNAIQNDFKMSIQGSYDQGLLCAHSINDENFKLVDINGQELKLPIKFKKIYILCIVSDHYPSLSSKYYNF